MLLQHEKAVPLPSRRGLFPSIFLALVFALAGCGGGGGGDGTPTDGGTTAITYAGNTNPASITTTNASTFVGNLIGGASVAEAASNVQPAAARELAGWSGLVSTLDRLLSRTRGVAAASATGTLEYRAAATVPVEETLPCDSGSMILSGSLDDQTGRGTLTVTFDACTTDGETWNGTGTFRVDATDLTYLEITDGLMSFPLLAITGAEVDISLSFDVRLQVVIDDNLERLTMNLVTRDNGTGDMLKYENLVEENVYGPSILSPSSYTQIVRGRLYDSTDGYVDVITPEVSPFSFTSIEQIYPDTGVLVVTGAVSNLRLVTEAAGRVVMDLDSDGDGVHETGVTLLWDEFGEPIAADIGDNDGDGMHNSWETTYGLNPEDSTDALLDTDGDGVSNYQEYLDRTDPTALPRPVEYQYTGNPYTSAIPPYTTAMFVTASIRLDNPLPSGLSLADVTGLSGFVLTMNDGIETLTSSSAVDVVEALISTDATGSIVGWALALHLTNGVGISSASHSAAMFDSDAAVDNASAATNAYVLDNAGTWTGPTVIP